MAAYEFKNLSRTAKVIVNHLILRAVGALMCPTTGLVIPMGSDFEWVTQLNLPRFGAHYIWLGFSYILVMEQSQRLANGIYADRVNIYQQGTPNLIGHALNGNGLFTSLQAHTSL